jgi:ketosteroid isomerase-like protein
MLLAMALYLATVTTPQQDVEAFQRDLIAALGKGDRAALEQMLTDGFTFVHSTGALDTKKMYIDSTVAAAQAGRAPDIEVLEDRIEVYDGRTAVATSRAVIHGRDGDMPLRSTHVYVKTANRWRWAGGQSTPLPVRPRALVTIAPDVRNTYAGRYALSDGRILTIAVDGDALMAQLPNFRRAELIPQSQTEFAWFNVDVNMKSELVFIDRDTVTWRRDGKEIWRAARVK